MIQRILNSKNFIAFLLTSVTGMALYFQYPFPSDNLFLRVIALRAPLVCRGALYSYTARRALSKLAKSLPKPSNEG